MLSTGLTSKSTGAAKTNSFVDILKGKKIINRTTIDLSSLPNPTLKEGEPALEIPLDFFKKDVNHSSIVSLLIWILQV